MGCLGNGQDAAAQVCLGFSFWFRQRTEALSVLLSIFWKTVHNPLRKCSSVLLLATGLFHLKHHALPARSCHNCLQMALISRANSWAPFPPLTWHPGTLPHCILLSSWEGILEIPYRHPLPIYLTLTTHVSCLPRETAIQ